MPLEQPQDLVAAVLCSARPQQLVAGGQLRVQAVPAAQQPTGKPERGVFHAPCVVRTRVHVHVHACTCPSIRPPRPLVRTATGSIQPGRDGATRYGTLVVLIQRASIQLTDMQGGRRIWEGPFQWSIKADPAATPQMGMEHTAGRQCAAQTAAEQSGGPVNWFGTDMVDSCVVDSR